MSIKQEAQLDMETVGMDQLERVGCYLLRQATTAAKSFVRGNDEQGRLMMDYDCARKFVHSLWQNWIESL